MNQGLLALYALVRGVIYVGLLALIGTQVAGALVARHREDADLAARLHGRLDPSPAWILPGLMIAMLARGLLQLLSLLDPGDRLTIDLARNGLLSGSWGHAWLLQVVAAGAAALWLRLRRREITQPDPVLAGLILAMLWGQTGMGHAAGDQWPGPTGRLLDLMHLAGAGVWLGTLSILLTAVIPLLRPPERLLTLATVVRGFSVFARIGAALVVASGITVAAVYSGGSITSLVASTWGRLLLLKLAGLLGVVALGWYNWRVVTPELECQGAGCEQRLRRAVRAELALGVLMLAITAFLVVSPLPGEG